MLYPTTSLRRSASLLLLLGGVAGCNCGTGIGIVAPVIEVTPPRLDFGSVAVGTVQELPLEVSNAGRANLNIASVTVQDMDDITLPSTEILARDCQDNPRNTSDLMQLHSGECARINVRFSPMMAEMLGTYIVITSNDRTHPTVKVPVQAVGTLEPIPEIQVCVLDASGMLDPMQCTDFTAMPATIPTLDFGMVSDGMKQSRSLRIFNKGTGTLSVTNVRVQSSSADVALKNPPTFPVSLASGTSGDIQVGLNPAGNGALTGKVVILSDDSSHSEVDIPITASEMSNAPPIISFTAPPITQMSPPVAEVSGTSNVAVTVGSVAPLTSVVITYDSNQPLVSWTNQPIATNLSKSISWAAILGFGAHTLTATATDANMHTGTAQRNIVVKCGGDSDCPSGQRCCSNDGTCNPIVAENADCDCDHPCPTDQGCFPGVCGATPQKCRPGCFPGSFNPPPYGTAPDACPPQDGLPAYCNPLPPGQATTQNKGGACAVGDVCDVGKQDCGMLPLDRTQPTGPNNPLVPYNCVPLAPNVNGCVPAGKLPPDGINCDGNVQPGVSGTVCGTQTSNCPVGYDCTTLVDGSGNALGPSRCSQLCSGPTMNPTVSGSGGCPSGQACDSTYGLGMVFFSSGSCCAVSGASCTMDTDCCDGFCNLGTCL